MPSVSRPIRSAWWKERARQNGVDLASVDASDGATGPASTGPLDPAKIAEALAKDPTDEVLVDGVPLTVAELQKLMAEGLIDPDTEVQRPDGAKTTAGLVAEACEDAGGCKANRMFSINGRDISFEDLAQAIEDGYLDDDTVITAADGSEMTVRQMKIEMGLIDPNIQTVAFNPDGDVFADPNVGAGGGGEDESDTADGAGDDGDEIVFVRLKDGGVHTAQSREEAAKYLADNADKVQSAQARSADGTYTNLDLDELRQQGAGADAASGGGEELATRVETSDGIVIEGGKSVDSYNLGKDVGPDGDGVDLVVATLDENGKVTGEQTVTLVDGSYVGEDGEVLVDENGKIIGAADLDKDPTKTLAVRCRAGLELCEVDPVSYGLGVGDADQLGDNEELVTETEVDDHYENIGVLSARYESRGDVGTVSKGGGLRADGRYQDLGCESYGTYQMTSCVDGDGGRRGGTVAKFVADPDNPYGHHFEGLEPGSAEFTRKWKEVAAADPEGFAAANHAYIGKTHYDPVVASVQRSTGVDLGGSSALANVAWSTGVQHGAGGGSRIMDRAVTDALAAGHEPGTPEFETAVIDSVYDQRPSKFGGSSQRVREAVAVRFEKERKIAMAMVDPVMPTPRRDESPGSVPVASRPESGPVVASVDDQPLLTRTGTGSGDSRSLAASGGDGRGTTVASAERDVTSRDPQAVHQPASRPSNLVVASNDTDSTDGRTPIVIRETLTYGSGGTDSTASGGGTFNDTVERVDPSEATQGRFPRAERQGEPSTDVVVDEEPGYTLTWRSHPQANDGLDFPDDGEPTGSYARYSLVSVGPEPGASDADDIIAGGGGPGGALGRALRQGGGQSSVQQTALGGSDHEPRVGDSQAGSDGPTDSVTAQSGPDTSARRSRRSDRERGTGDTQSPEDFEREYRNRRRDGSEPPRSYREPVSREAAEEEYRASRGLLPAGASNDSQPTQDPQGSDDGGGGGIFGFFSRMWNDRETGDGMFTGTNEEGRQRNAQNRRADVRQARNREERANTGGSGTGNNAPQRSESGGGGGGIFGDLGRALRRGSSEPGGGGEGQHVAYGGDRHELPDRSGSTREPPIARIPREPITEDDYRNSRYGSTPTDSGSSGTSSSSGSFWTDTAVGRGLSSVGSWFSGNSQSGDGMFTNMNESGRQTNDQHRRGEARQARHRAERSRTGGSSRGPEPQNGPASGRSGGSGGILGGLGRALGQGSSESGGGGRSQSVAYGGERHEPPSRSRSSNEPPVATMPRNQGSSTSGSFWTDNPVGRGLSRVGSWVSGNSQSGDGMFTNMNESGRRTNDQHRRREARQARHRAERDESPPTRRRSPARPPAAGRNRSRATGFWSGLWGRVQRAWANRDTSQQRNWGSDGREAGQREYYERYWRNRSRGATNPPATRPAPPPVPDNGLVVPVAGSDEPLDI